MSAVSSITQLERRCWVLRSEPDGRHWLTWDAALECAEREDIMQLPSVCWVGECGGCGEDMGDDDRFSQVHFETRAQLDASARDFDWLVQGDDLFHPDCAPQDGSDG